MAGVRFAELQSRPMEFLYFTNVTLDEFQPLVPPFEAASRRIWRHGASMANRGRPAGSPCTRTVRSRRRKIACSSCSPP